MVEYQKETVAKLTEILKSRSLPTSGKKAELIARLQEADQAAQANDAEAAPPAPSTSAPPEQDPSTIAQESAPEPAVTQTEDAAAAGNRGANPAGTDTAPKPDYSLHLPTSTIDAELEKRKARAARFGTTAANADGAAETNGAENASATATTTTTTEHERALARAQRFGLSASETATVGKLDVALSSEKPKGRRQGPKEGDHSNGNTTFDDPGLLRRGGRGGRFGRGGGGGGGGGRGSNRREGSVGAKPTGVEKRGAGYSDADRKAAEARKARFAQG